MVLFEERGPKLVEDHAESSPNRTKRTRKTGLDRDVVKKIEDYLTTGDGPVSMGKVAAQYGVGKGLLSKLYSRMVENDQLGQTDTGRYFRIKNRKIA